MSSAKNTQNPNSAETRHVNCYRCEYLFITHEKNKRYGCKKFGFKGPYFPSITVFSTTGTKCAYFKLKKRLQDSESLLNQSRGRE